MIKAYLDNSVLSLLRLNKKKGAALVLNTKHIKLTFQILKQYNIAATNMIITDMLFLELIGHGNVRKKIINKDKNKELINDKKAGLRSIQSSPQKIIEEYIYFLEDFFNSKLREELLQDCIHTLALTSLQAYPFIDLLHCFEQKIIQYAKYINDSDARYEELISALVADSVVRCLLLDPDISLYFKNSLSYLLKKYRDSFYPNLLSIMAGLKQDVEQLNKLKGRKNLLRLKDDFADAEPYEFVFWGKEIDGAHYPVTLLTYEKIETVEERLKYYFAGFVTTVQNQQQARRYFCLGRTIVITNFEEFCFKEIPSSNYLQYIPSSSYESLSST